MVMLSKDQQLESNLYEEKLLIESDRLKEVSPLDLTEGFSKLCLACRKGDLKSCQEQITGGVNINAHDQYDYTPLILASLCGHYEVVQLLLESGAFCERDTFQGERCLSNSLNDRIRNMLLAYDYSKSTDPLQPFAAHITSLLLRDTPKCSDITVSTPSEVFRLHKFILTSRSPYFSKKLAATPAATSWKLTSAIPPQAFGIAIKHIYLGEIPIDVGGGPGTGFSEDEVLEGINKISKQLEIRNPWDGIRIDGGDHRLARQRRVEEVEKGRNQLEAWFKANVLRHKISIEVAKADTVKWDRSNSIFADVLLRADEPEDDLEQYESVSSSPIPMSRDSLNSLKGIPVGPISRSPSRTRKPRACVLFPAHRAMLLRSEFFLTMFSSAFCEAQSSGYLQITTLDCSPEVLEVVLTYLYTDKTDIPLKLAVDVLLAADLLFIDRLKLKAAVVLSTLGNGSMAQKSSGQEIAGSEAEEEVINIYDVVRAGWLTRVPRLEEFAARYFAYRLESYVDEPEFAELIQESASRIKGRQETDSIELLDELRYYLSERFRLRFEDAGLEEMMDEDAAAANSHETTDNVLDAKASKISDGGMRTTSDDVGVTDAMPSADPMSQVLFGDVNIIDGHIAGDAIKYRVLLGKIDALLYRLKLDA